MIVDTSVLVAILRREPECDDFLSILTNHAPTKLSAGSLIELQTVAIKKRLPDALGTIAGLLSQLDIRITPVDREQAELAGEGFVKYGQGAGTVSALNFGDCFAYALAISTGEPLLFKGSDFAKTDVERVVA